MAAAAVVRLCVCVLYSGRGVLCCASRNPTLLRISSSASIYFFFFVVHKSLPPPYRKHCWGGIGQVQTAAHVSVSSVVPPVPHHLLNLGFVVCPFCVTTCHSYYFLMNSQGYM